MKTETTKMFTDHFIKEGLPVSLSDKEGFVQPYDGTRNLYVLKYILL